MSDREREDQKLFEDIAAVYAAKDLAPSIGAARRQRAIQTLAGLQNAGDMLEVGCGAGYAAVYLDGRYDTYTGVDYSENLIDFARNRHHAPHREFLVENARNMAHRRKFDTILMIGVLHHMPDPAVILRSLSSALKPGGKIVVNEPQSANPIVSWAREVRKKLNNEYSDEQEEYTENQLRNIFESAGFHDIKLRAQGLFSTPFAEVKMPAQFIATPMSHLACALDRAVEARNLQLMKKVSWNLIAEASI